MACLDKVTSCYRQSGNRKYYQCQVPGDLPLVKMSKGTNTWLTDPVLTMVFWQVIPGIAAAIIGILAGLIIGISAWLLWKYLKLIRSRSAQLKEFPNKFEMRISSDNIHPSPIEHDKDVSSQRKHDLLNDVLGTECPNSLLELGGENKFSDARISLQLEDDDEDDPNEEYGILTGTKRKKNAHQHHRVHHHHHGHQVKRSGVANILMRVREGVLGKEARYSKGSGSSHPDK